VLARDKHFQPCPIFECTPTTNRIRHCKRLHSGTYPPWKCQTGIWFPGSNTLAYFPRRQWRRSFVSLTPTDKTFWGRSPLLPITSSNIHLAAFRHSRGRKTFSSVIYNGFQKDCRPDGVPGVNLEYFIWLFSNFIYTSLPFWETAAPSNNVTV